MDTKRVIKKFYEHLYDHKFDNPDEMDQVFEKHNLLKLKQEEIDNLNKSISIKEMESIISNLPKQKAPCRAGFTGEFYQAFKEKTIAILYKKDKILKKSYRFILFLQRIVIKYLFAEVQ